MVFAKLDLVLGNKCEMPGGTQTILVIINSDHGCGVIVNVSEREIGKPGLNSIWVH